MFWCTSTQLETTPVVQISSHVRLVVLNVTPLFHGLQDEMKAQVTTLEQLMYRSSAELLQPTPGAAAVLPLHHLHLAAAPAPQQQGQQQGASAAWPSPAGPQRGTTSVPDAVPSPPEKWDIWCSLPLPAISLLPIPSLSRTCPNCAYMFIYLSARWEAIRNLVTAPPAGPDMHRPHTRVQCLLAVSCRLALHASDMNYPLQSGLALCLLSGVAGCSPVFKLLHACAKFASTAPGRASQQAQAVPGTCLEIAT